MTTGLDEAPSHAPPTEARIMSLESRACRTLAALRDCLEGGLEGVVVAHRPDHARIGVLLGGGEVCILTSQYPKGGGSLFWHWSSIGTTNR